jgi:hypothetical protein
MARQVALELAASGPPQTPEGVPEDVLEAPVGVPEVVPDTSPKVEPEEVLAEEPVLAVHAAIPSPPHAAAGASSPAPDTAASAGAAVDAVGGPEVIMGHPTFHAPGDVSLDEAVSTALRALSQV